MFKNYLSIAFRTLWKNKVFTGINIMGLSIGISASLVIYLLVNYHFNFDKFQPDGDRIYRVVSNFNFSGDIFHNSGVPDPMGAAVRREITGLDRLVSFRTWDGDAKVSVNDVQKDQPVVFKKQQGVVFADSNYFVMVPYKWIAGSPGTSFTAPYQVVLTTSNASLYFPGLDPSRVVGKTIYFNDTVATTITGVVQDISGNTDFTFKAFLSYVTLEKGSLKPASWEEWGNTTGSQQLWVRLSAGTNAARVEQQLQKMFKSHHKQEPGNKDKAWHTLQPLSDLHFNADYGSYSMSQGHKPTLYGLLAVAVFLLLLACINFINLTTANGAQRAKEIGIRKTMGSSRKQLVFQFLSETSLLTITATLISCAITPLILKAFSSFIPQELHFNLFQEPGIILFLLVLIIIVTVLSGSYPAIILSAYKPVLVLKNQAYANSGKTRNAWLRRSLTVSQFVIAQVFIMGAILVSKQITYSLTRDLGFKKDAIIYLETNYYDTIASHKYLLRDKLKAIPGISMVSLSSNPPSSGSTWSGTMKYIDGKKEIETNVQQKFGDTNYLPLYQLKLLAGTNFAQTDTVQSLIINETYARLLGFTQLQQAIGKKITWSEKQLPIAGVVADFHQKSLHEPIKPLAMGSWDWTERTVNIALQPKSKEGSSWKSTLSQIETAWKQVYPEDDFEYSFFDADIAKFYKAEQQISGLLKWATGLSVFISCLGLLGLVIHTTTQRTKEIGVRKVLGASVVRIVAMVSRDFILLVLIAFVIAAPLAGFGMYKWLENFTYRTEISWWIFLLGGSMMVLIALLTLGYETIRAATANPVKSLRTE